MTETLLVSVKTAANIAGTGTPATVSTRAKLAPAPKVDILEVVAAAAALGVVRPAMTHTTAAFKARGLPSSILKLGEEYVVVIVPGIIVPALVHVVEGKLPLKLAKPVTVITAAAVADAPVNPRVMEEAVEMTLLENETEAEVKAPANTNDKTKPDATPADATVSASVCTVMPVALPAVAAPIVTPLRVMVKEVVAAMPTTAVVMTMELAEMADVAVMLLTDVLPAALAAGLGVPAKNPGG